MIKDKKLIRYTDQYYYDGYLRCSTIHNTENLKDLEAVFRDWGGIKYETFEHNVLEQLGCIRALLNYKLEKGEKRKKTRISR